MTDRETEAALADLGRLLLRAVGPEHGVTIDEITRRLSLSDRRATEQLIQFNLRRLPCLVVADSHGYYRPTCAGQINAYIGNLRKRHQPLVLREEVTVLKARAENWPREGDLFVDPPSKQVELFA